MALEEDESAPPVGENANAEGATPGLAAPRFTDALPNPPEPAKGTEAFLSFLAAGVEAAETEVLPNGVNWPVVPTLLLNKLLPVAVLPPKIEAPPSCP